MYEDQPSPEPVPPMHSFGMIVGLVWGLIWPVIMLLWLSRGSIRAEVANWGQWNQQTI